MRRDYDYVPKFEDYDVKPVIGRMRGGATCIHATCAYLDDLRGLQNFIKNLDEETMNKVREQACWKKKREKRILRNLYETAKRERC